MTNAIQTIEGDVYGVERTFNAVLADKSIAFEREAGFAMQALCASDFAMETALRNRQSVVDAVTNIAAVGISLNPAKKQAYLVPRDGRICLDISYMGLMDLAMQTGAIRWAQCVVVHAGDTFTLRGMDKQPEHQYNPFAKDRGEPVGVYCVVKTADGDYLTHAMAIEDVYAIRDRSMAWKKKQSGPWKTDPGEMIKKTCVKQACKYWPKRSARLDQAIHHLNIDGEGIEFERPPATGVIGSGKPRDGAMESLDRETQNYLRELAAEATELFDLHGVEACYDRIAADELEDVQKVAFWGELKSNIRTALTKEGEARRAAIKAIPSSKESQKEHA